MYIYIYTYIYIYVYNVYVYMIYTWTYIYRGLPSRFMPCKHEILRKFTNAPKYHHTHVTHKQIYKYR